MESIFNRLNAVNVNGHIEKKNGLSYLSWAWAWAEVKKMFPAATYTVYERDTEYGAVPYFTDGRTCWVKTGVTIEGLEHIEMLPIMDFKNRSIALEAVDSMAINKAIQRSLTKACARHGLGLYIYAGEDLPEGEEEPKKPAELRKADSEPTSIGDISAADIIRRYCNDRNISMKQFGNFRATLLNNGLAEDVPSGEMTAEQAYKLTEDIEKNFFSEATA